MVDAMVLLAHCHNARSHHTSPIHTYIRCGFAAHFLKAAAVGGAAAEDEVRDSVDDLATLSACVVPPHTRMITLEVRVRTAIARYEYMALANKLCHYLLNHGVLL